MSLFLALYRFLLSLRYDVSITGAELLAGDCPILLLPNHIALVDPQILMSYLGRYRQVCPVITETYYRLPVLNNILQAIGAIPVADLESGAIDIDAVRSVFAFVTGALKERKTVLLYPAGRIYVQGFESIVGKQSAYEVVRTMPEDTRVLTIRTRGLWGSMWSKAYTGDSLSLGKVIGISILALISGLVFWVPRRRVTIEIVDMTDRLRAVSRNTLSDFNNLLEGWYNAPGDEGCRFIPHFWFFDDAKGKTESRMIRGSLAELAQTMTHDTSAVPDDVWDFLRMRIAAMRSIDPSAVMETSHLILDLHCDSLDLAELKSSVQARYPASSNPPLLDLKTVADLAIMAIGQSRKEETLRPCEWNTIESSHTLFDRMRDMPEDATVLSLFRDVFSHEKNKPFVYDAFFGLQTRRDFMTKAYVVAEYIRSLPGDRVGIMLPATASASLLVVATLLAGKTPVMLNWTVGDRAFSHCMSFSGMQTVLTSRVFYEKIKTPWLSVYEGSFGFLESIIPTISMFQKVFAIIKSLLFILPSHTSDEAVMLFTSGSESLPKAVVLTHANLLANIRGSLEVFALRSDDILLGFLPPFHSFGFTINTILPLVTGLRSAYTPDPNDAKTIAQLLAHVRATVVTATPTFFRAILGAGTLEDVQSLRYAVLGAEKCPQDLARLLSEKCPAAKVLEGYGITECSPVIAINPIDRPKLGSVGRVVSSLDITIRAIDDIAKIMPTDEQGMIYVRGRSVFGGYVDASITSPFQTIDGAEWYSTGDLGMLDSDGYLSITGRMKRFVKIAGEMVSLPFIETILMERYGDPDAVTLAVEAREHEGDVRIVLFTTGDIALDEANTLLRSRGAGNLIKIHEVRRLDAIPVLGTGKINYRELKGMIG